MKCVCVYYEETIQSVCECGGRVCVMRGEREKGKEREGKREEGV